MIFSDLLFALQVYVVTRLDGLDVSGEDGVVPTAVYYTKTFTGEEVSHATGGTNGLRGGPVCVAVGSGRRSGRKRGLRLTVENKKRQPSLVRRVFTSIHHFRFHSLFFYCLGVSVV